MSSNDCNASDIFDVVVLGCGPVGATLANLLVQQGLRVAVLERESSVYHLARAGHFDAEAMRVFQSLGIAEKVEETTGITVASRFVDADGALLMESRRQLEKGLLGWVSDYMFFQPTLELMLRQRLGETGGATVLLRHDVYGVEDAGDHVLVRAEALSTGRLTVIRGRYVVGCDGARSLVRRTIGSEHEDFGFRQRWLVVDVKQHRDLGLERATTHHCRPERPMVASALSQDVLRWEVMVHDSDDVAAMTTHEAIWRFIEQSIRPISPSDGTIIRSAVYTFESVLAHRWRKGRLLIAGDSAHRTPPFLGQGMCAGIRDAANLAWKLACVLGDRAGDELLDTYETERKPHIREFIVGAVEAGRILQMADAKELDARAKAMRASPLKWGPPNPPLGPGLGCDYGTGGLGWQIPQPVVKGRLLDDHVGHHFALVYAEHLMRRQDIERIAARYPLVRLVALDDETYRLLGECCGAVAVLVRPDRYVHATAHTAEETMAMLDGLPVRLAAA